jgi:hypothetical protein
MCMLRVMYHVVTMRTERELLESVKYVQYCRLACERERERARERESEREREREREQRRLDIRYHYFTPMRSRTKRNDINT